VGVRRRRISLAVATALVLAALMAPARAQDDPPEPAAEPFWAKLLHPHRARTAELASEGTTLLASGDVRGAALVLEQAVKLDPTEPTVLYLLGVVRHRAHEYSACADALARLWHVQPGFVPAAPRFDADSVGATLGMCYLLAGRYDEAAAHYRGLLASGDAGLPPEALHDDLGDSYQALGRMDDAIAEYTLAAVAAPRSAPPLFALAVALDRDEQIARAEEAITRALAIDPALSSLSGANVLFVPPEDAHYTYGLAFQVASAGDPLRRLLAQVRFHRYLAAAPSGPWARRARAHLAQLGSPALSASDVLVSPADAPDRDAIVRAVVALGPDLQRCMADDKDGAVRAALRLAPAAQASATRPLPTGLARPLTVRPPAERSSTLALDVEPISRQANECIQKILDSARIPVRQPALVLIAVTARMP
jgi:tetratricopeptide (TPR) repeat protein